MKKFLAILMAGMMLILAAACASTAGTAPNATAASATATDAPDDWAYIESNGKMVIGITIYEPMNYYDADGKLVGFDTEFTQAVCEKLGVEPEFVEINWDTKEVELAAKNIDCIWNGLTVTEERKENMDFSESYIKNKQVLVIKKDNAAQFADTASLSAATLAAEISSAGETAIQDDENLSKATYVSVSKQSDALLEVKAGTADAAVIDYTMASAMVGEGTDYSDLMIVDGVELSVEEYAIGFRLGSTAVAKVNAVIDELIADGTLNAIAEKYDMTASLLSNQ